MRSDMKKVLTERPRRGGRDTYKSLGKRTRSKKVHEDESGKTQGMRRPYMETGDWKEFNDLIGPLYRFVQSRCGKPWKKVHSEICVGLKGRNTVQQHLLDHLKRMVATDLFWENGKLLNRNGTPIFGHGRDYYVDPRDGILKPIPESQRVSWWKDDRKKIMDAEKEENQTLDGQVFRRIDGIWYEVTTSVAMVTVNGPDGPWMEERREHKRQLGSAELKKRGLANVAVLD